MPDPDQMVRRVQTETVVVLSGGLDSAVLAFSLHQRGENFRLIYLDYGKPVSTKEKRAARQISSYLGRPLEIVNLHGLADLQGGLVLLGGGQDELDVK